MRAGVFIARTHPLGGIIINNAQTLIPADLASQAHLNIVKMPVFRGPAVAVIDLDVTTGDFVNGSRGNSSHPEI